MRDVLADLEQTCETAPVPVCHTPEDGFKDQSGFELAVKAGWKVGVGLSMEESTADAVAAQFLGAPGPDGKRIMVDDATCMK